MQCVTLYHGYTFIFQQETHCKAIGCRMDVGSLSCGYFQIKYNYWLDCGKPGAGTYGVVFMASPNDIEITST